MQRIIARLDIKNSHVIKGIHLEGQRKIGNPLEIAKKYYQNSVDEILIMDSVASLYDRNNIFDMISQACKSVFVPITMGGGIRSIDDVKAALNSGADKVAINSAIVNNPELVNEISNIYGSQILVASIEAKQKNNNWEVFINNGREPTGINVINWAKELERRGIGELLVTSIDKEGTQRGFDLELYSSLGKEVNVPIIASGGAGNINHIKYLDKNTNVQGIALASVLHYEKLEVNEIKSVLPNSLIRNFKPNDNNY